MLKLNILLFIFELTLCPSLTWGQSYENARCNCICTVINETQIFKKQYIANVPPNNDCDSVILPSTNEFQKNNHAETFCPICQCKYESRNTTTIKYVVIFVVWVISLLLIYMMILICLDNSLNFPKRKSNYVEHTNEEVCSLLDDYNGERHFDESPNQSHPSGISQFSDVAGPSASIPVDSGSTANVLNRVSHHQDKWKRQVREQRKNIYDRHTMLN